jgi:pyruvate/2-oxoglutarate/acetoin dehydrogenase E1 component
MMTTLKYYQAITEGIAEEMERDSSVVLFGEDVAEAGGTFGQTRGLLAKFGPERVRDTPISEALLTGMAIGAAMTGLRPIVEIMYEDFITLASDQLVNHAAKVRSMSAGEFSVPMVLRTMSGAGRNSGPQHSQNFESWLAHIPGLKIVVPATPRDMKGLLKAAIRDPDPVVVIESQRLWSTKGEAGDQEELVPIGKASILRHGTDVTLISWSATIPRTLAAAETLAAEGGISAEVLDLRTLSPLDTSTILESVSRTGRAVIVHDAVGPFGPGAEIAALIADTGFHTLRAPVRRVTSLFTPVPLPKFLEEQYFPQEADIVRTIRDLLG